MADNPLWSDSGVGCGGCGVTGNKVKDKGAAETWRVDGPQLTHDLCIDLPLVLINLL